jgi:hypothetical protein
MAPRFLRGWEARRRKRFFFSKKEAVSYLIFLEPSARHPKIVKRWRSITKP